MNRQRRLDAIAKRRALIDSQIQMLSNTESRVPNIIRSRTGRTQMSSSRPSNTQFVECFQNRQSTMYSSQLIQTTSEAFAQRPPSISKQPFTIEQSPQGEEVYMAVLNDNGQGGHKSMQLGDNTVNSQNETGEGVPIIISENFANIYTGGTDQLSHPLQTIEAPDGTVMVVLEGNHFNEGDAEFSTNVNDASLVSDQEAQELFLSSNATTIREGSTNEDAGTEPESYIIVQTADGDVLVPSSKLCSQLQTQMVSSDESIVQFIATESGAIEELISNSTSSERNSSSASKPTNQNRSKQNKSQRVSLPTVKKPMNVKNLNNVNKLTHFSGNFSSSPQVLSKKSNGCDYTIQSQSHKNINVSSEIETSSSSAHVCQEEKPRPFRFELPDMENDLDDCFMSVPVPITIDSLRSETEKNKYDGTFTTPQKRLADFSVPTTNSGLVTTTGKEDDVISDPKLLDKRLLLEDTKLVSDGSGSGSNVLAVQAGQLEGSPDLNLHTDDCISDSVVQCIQCFEIFFDEPSFLIHAPQCQPCIRNDTVNGITEASLVSNLDEQLQMDSCKNLEFNHQLENCNNSDDDKTEGNLIIKSVNSLSVPNFSTLTNVSIEPNFSSPAKSDRHDASTFYVESKPKQQAPTSLVFSSNDGIPKDEDAGNFCVQLDNDSNTVHQSPSKKVKLSQNTSTESSVESSNVDVFKYVERTNTELVESSCVLNGVAQPIKCDTSTETAYEISYVDNFDVGRRTLSKVSAKANLPIDTEESEGWSPSSYEIDLDQPDTNGNTVSLQSARIRSRNDRIKAMDKNGTSEEELGFNFRNIFEQVVKQSITFQ